MSEIPKFNPTFTDRDYCKMAESGFQCTGWKTYQESPYYEYERLTGQTQKYLKERKNNEV